MDSTCLNLFYPRHEISRTILTSYVDQVQVFSNPYSIQIRHLLFFFFFFFFLLDLYVQTKRYGTGQGNDFPLSCTKLESIDQV